MYFEGGFEKVSKLFSYFKINVLNVEMFIYLERKLNNLDVENSTL